MNLLFIKHISFTARTVENDLNILKERFNITLQNVNTTRSFGFFISFIKQFIFLLYKIYRFKIIYIWFADYHSFLPVFFSKIFRKISIVNLGGYDADEILPEEALTLKQKFRKFCVSYSVKNCTKLLPVSEPVKEHLLEFAPHLKPEVINCCVDTSKFKPEDMMSKENLVITIGGGGDFIKEALRKKLDFFIEIGNQFNERYPEYDAKFYLIGHNEETQTYKYLRNFIKHPNVQLKAFAETPEELINYMQKASVYMQLSHYEAFGIAQIEAMLYGCIPVSNPGGAIPYVVGDAGFLIKDYRMDEYIRVIKEILDGKHENLRLKARQRVMQNFSLESRRKKLLQTIDYLLNS
ncbi:MAG: glycosyltransferase family 4 protein [Ignavibacteria bacterium]|nr:glycosyltransferase family 4 protein [Ignavibacteria bacterium]